jgi:putative lipoic acid-binding regulatory protein
MKVLVAGCSFAENLTPIIKKRIPNAEITNLSQSAAGNKYISDSVVTATSQEQFDLVYVSWSGLSRYDVCINLENKTLFTDWSAKAFLSNQYYIFTGGVGGWDHRKHSFADMLFKNYHALADHEQLYYNSILEILKTQGYLKSLKIPAYHTCMINQFVADPNTMMQHTCEYGTQRFPNLQKLVDQIDFSNWILENQLGIFENCARLNLLSEDNFHPAEQGYIYWIDKFIARLKNDKIL